MLHDHDYPPLPTLGELLVDEPRWRYPTTGIGGGMGEARLRVWQTADHEHHLVAVVTELGVGLSITNGIEHIWAALTLLFPGRPLILLEHWPADQSGESGDHIDQADIVAGAPVWRRVWPTPSDNPDHLTNRAWIAHNGHVVLSTDTSV